MKEKIIGKYKLLVDEVPADIIIKKTAEEFVPLYELSFPHIKEATEAVLDTIREKLISEMEIKSIVVSDSEDLNRMRERFLKKSYDYILAG